MLISHTAVKTTSAGVLALVSIAALGQSYPNKPIRMITTEAGGGSDFTARLIAQEISGPLGRPVVVENRTGVIAEAVAKAAPDGYTLLVYGTPLWVTSLLQKTSYDPVKDFAPITLAIRSPNILVVHPSLPVKSVKELIALAKAKPGTLNYASGVSGSSSHLATELFRVMAGINIVRIPYKSNGPALNAMMAGDEVQLWFGQASTAAPQVQSGRLRALAVSTAQPSPLFPDLPTVAASGVPGYESVGYIGVFAPARTPTGVVALLNQEIVKALSRPEVKKRFLDTAVEAAPSTPEEFAGTIRSDMTTLDKMIKDLGIHAE